MRRQAIIIAAVCLAVVAGVLPMFAIYQIQRDRAFKSEQNHLDEYARWTWLRADRTLTDAKHTLARIAAEDTRETSALKSWALKITKRRGLRKARVALARRLAVIMHAMLRDGTLFEA